MQGKIDIKTLRPVVKDPVRFPGVIKSYEGQAKSDFAGEMKLMYADIVKRIVKILK